MPEAYPAGLRNFACGSNVTSKCPTSFVKAPRTVPSGAMAQEPPPVGESEPIETEARRR